MTHYDNFTVLMDELKNKKRQTNLLLGNGFSMAYNREIFSYNALFDLVTSDNRSIVAQILTQFQTQNFEIMMTQIDAFLELLTIFDGPTDLKENAIKAKEDLKKSLVHAIQKLHPSNAMTLSDNATEACASFLQLFLDSGGKIFTTNYDLLLYWVLMKKMPQLGQVSDGFGRGEIEAGDNPPLHWGPNKTNQNIFYIHGALPFFDRGTSVEKEEYTEFNYLLSNIQERINNDNYPLFVTAGTGDEKLSQIRTNPYLTYSYEELATCDGSIVSFGFAFGESDSHIIDALNRASPTTRQHPPKLRSIYIGVFDDNDKQRAEQLQHRLNAKVHTYDARTAPVWEESS